MENLNTNGNEKEQKSLQDTINLLRNNITALLIIILASTTVAIVYALNTVDIYKSTTTLKISKPTGNILEAPLIPEFQDFGSDRFVANEIEILKSYNLREKVAYSLKDTFNAAKNTSKFHVILERENFGQKNPTIKPVPEIAKSLTKISIEQKRGLDIVEISAESPSPYEASLIANCYANNYLRYSLDLNRNQLTLVKQFLKEQKDEKQKELNNAEQTLKEFQEKGGIIALDEQAKNLIDQLSQFEAERNAAKIQLEASNKMLSQYKAELEKQDPKLSDYLRKVADEAYLKGLQEQIAKLEINKDIALSTTKNSNNPVLEQEVKEYERKISELRKKLNDKIDLVKASIFASSPEEVKELTKRLLEEDIKNKSYEITYNQLGGIVSKYDAEFNQLPKTTIEFARFQRNREALEKLYILVEEKYHEALINEQSQPSNVVIIDDARIPATPSKPNRMLIIVVGLFFGIGLGVGYVLIRNYFDNTIKTPEDIQNLNINVLSWIPQIEGVTDTDKEFEFIVAKKSDSIPAEAFRSLRTRILFSKTEDDQKMKTLMFTSSAPQEGKTTLCINLAGSFAQANMKVLVIDCDLRKPRVHNAFRVDRIPGLIDHLYADATLNEIIKPTEIENLFFIPSGTIPPNPAETLGSKKMRSFLNSMEESFDLILIDTPPIIAVADSEIIARLVDASILVASSENTEKEMMQRSAELLENGSASFLGAVLNNFTYKSGYGSYYKYYYYYSKPTNASSNSKQSNKGKKLTLK